LLDTDRYVDNVVYLYMKIPVFWDVLLFIPKITNTSETWNIATFYMGFGILLTC